MTFWPISACCWRASWLAGRLAVSRSRHRRDHRRGRVLRRDTHSEASVRTAAHDSTGPAAPRRRLIDDRDNGTVRPLCRHACRLALICLLALHASAAGAVLFSSAPVHHVDSHQSAAAGPHDAPCSSAHSSCSAAYSCTPLAALAPSRGFFTRAPHAGFAELARRCSGYVPALESRPPLAFPV